MRLYFLAYLVILFVGTPAGRGAKSINCSEWSIDDHKLSLFIYNSDASIGDSKSAFGTTLCVYTDGLIQYRAHQDDTSRLFSCQLTSEELLAFAQNVDRTHLFDLQPVTWVVPDRPYLLVGYFLGGEWRVHRWDELEETRPVTNRSDFLCSWREVQSLAAKLILTVKDRDRSEVSLSQAVAISAFFRECIFHTKEDPSEAR